MMKLNPWFACLFCLLSVLTIEVVMPNHAQSAKGDPPHPDPSPPRLVLSGTELKVLSTAYSIYQSSRSVPEDKRDIRKNHIRMGQDKQGYWVQFLPQFVPEERQSLWGGLLIRVDRQTLKVTEVGVYE